MITKEEIKQFIDSELESYGFDGDFSEIDSLTRVEIIMECENEYLIGIDEEEIEKEHNWTTDKLIDFIIAKIDEKNDPARI